METIARTFDTPLLVNIVEGGRTPQLTPAELRELGFSIAIYPASGFLAVAKALQDVYGQIKAQRGTRHVENTMYPFSEMCKLMGFPAVCQFDREHAE
ncbi:2-methylisocitrate lyase-like PEP mutase family enzyme [Paraburkholderia youngii]|uniref:hypothetical protein n=1 Tax=Paraburkholderia TaxID=1822464 RepID=UPI0034CE7049